MRLQTIAIFAALALVSTAHAQSIWGTGGQKSSSPAIIAPLPQQSAPPSATTQPQVAPEADPAPTHAAPAPAQTPAQSAPAPAQPKWSLDNVPSDPIPLPAPPTSGAGDQARPPIVMDKGEVSGLVTNQESRKFLERYAQGDSLVFPQNPPEMNEKTAQILPFPQTQLLDENIEDFPDFSDECLSVDCLDSEQKI